MIENVSVDEVTLTGSEGQIQILPGHAKMIGELETGPFKYLPSGGSETNGFISHGFFEVLDDKVVVTAETLELKGEIDVNRAKKAQKLAEDALQDANLDESKFKKYQLKLQRALIRQHLGE